MTQLILQQAEQIIRGSASTELCLSYLSCPQSCCFTPFSFQSDQTKLNQLCYSSRTHCTFHRIMGAGMKSKASSPSLLLRELIDIVCATKPIKFLAGVRCVNYCFAACRVTIVWQSLMLLVFFSPAGGGGSLSRGKLAQVYQLWICLQRQLVHHFWIGSRCTAGGGKTGCNDGLMFGWEARRSSHTAQQVLF